MPVATGAYLATSSWRSLSAREQYVVRVHTRLLRLGPSIVGSHWSAAAIWGFPVADAWPDVTQVVDASRTTANRSGAVMRRPGVLDPDDVTTWQGVCVTTPARTAADLALTSPFATAVMLFDHGLHGQLFTINEVRRVLASRPAARRRASAWAALAFASPLAEWPGESFSRVGVAARGLEVPALQRPFFDAEGKIGTVDFLWAEAGVVGEFDGDWKYSDPRFLRGRTPAEVIRDEKRRQARLEAHPEVRHVVRWDYPVARNPDELARRLVAAGVRRLRSGGAR